MNEGAGARQRVTRRLILALPFILMALTLIAAMLLTRGNATI
jgi:hypothetical protein